MIKKGNHRFQHGRSGAALAVRVTSPAPANQITGIQSDGSVEIQLAAPLIGKELDQALIEFLAGILDISVGQIQVVAGSAGQGRLVAIDEMDAERLQRKILTGLASNKIHIQP